MAWRKQLFVAYCLALLVTSCHAQDGQKNLTTANKATTNNPDDNNKPADPLTRPIMTARPKQNITLNDLLTALMNIQNNQLSTTENPIAANNKNPVTGNTVAPINPTTPNPEININDILSGEGKGNQSVIILNIGDLLRTQLGGANELKILNGLNGINCQQGYIYVLLPGGQGKFFPLNQANMLPQNGVPSYIILTADGQPDLSQNPNWQLINGMLPNLGINIPGLSKIGSIPIYAPTNSPSPGGSNSNVQQPNLYPNNNVNIPTNPNSVVNLGVGSPNHQTYPNPTNNPNNNFVKMPLQPTDTSNNWNLDPNRPGININLPTPAPQPNNPDIVYPNFNIIQQPLQPIGVPNVNNPAFTVNVPNQSNQPVNTGVPNMNIIWPSQLPVNPGMNVVLPTQPTNQQLINFPGISIPNKPIINPGINIPINSGVSIPGNGFNVPTQPISQPIQSVYPSGININGTNLINLLKVLITGLPDQNGVSPNYIPNNVPNLIPTVPNQVGNNVGLQYPTGNIPGSTTSNGNIDLLKLIELLGLKISNVPSRINPEISISNIEKRPNIHQQTNIPESELLNNLLEKLGNAGSDGKRLNNDHVKITIEKGQHDSKQSVPHLIDMLLHYINKNTDPLLKSNNFESIRTENNKPISPEDILQFLNKLSNDGNNPHMVSGIIPQPVNNVPVIKLELLGQNNPNLNVGKHNYNPNVPMNIPNVPMNIPNNGFITGQVAIDPQYLANLMKTFSEVNLPNNYITSGVQPFINQNFETQPGASRNNVLWNYLLVHLGCIPNDQSLGGNYIPNFANQIHSSNWAQVPQFSNTGMSFRNKRATAKKS